MIIIKQTSEVNNAYFSQDWYSENIPIGFIMIPEEFISIWEQYKPFVNFTIVNGVITNMTDSPEARNAQSILDLEENTKNEIENFKVKLNITDYKIIKCYEYSLAGLELPYDIEALHAERQSIRDQINLLESSLQ